MTKMNNPKFTTPSGDTAPRQVWQQTVDAVLAQTKSQAAGLSSADAAERLNSCGPNALPEKKGKPAWLRFLAHFNDVLIYVLLAAAALRLVSGGMAGLELILSVFIACSGAALLYALIAQRRSGAFAPTALLVPVCFLVVQLIVTYRANARDSVLGHFYVELLLLAALCLASLYLAAFAYRCGAPRSFAPAAHLALTLAAACCVDMALARRFAGLAACLGAALLLLAYLEAAGDFEG